MITSFSNILIMISIIKAKRHQPAQSYECQGQIDLFINRLQEKKPFIKRKLVCWLVLELAGIRYNLADVNFPMRFVNLNLFPRITIIIQQLRVNAMSFVYPFFGCFNPYPPALLPFFIPTELQPTPPTPDLADHRSSQADPKETGQFKPLVLLPTATSESLQQLESRVRERKKSDIKRESAKEKDEVYGWRNQNKERNQNSIILRGYAHHVLHSAGMQAHLQNLSQKKQIQNGVSRFLQFVAQKFPARKSYVGLRYVEELMRAQSFQEDMTFLLVMSLRLYLREVYPLQIVENSKLRRRARLGLLKKARAIAAVLFAC